MRHLIACITVCVLFLSCKPKPNTNSAQSWRAIPLTYAKGFCLYENDSAQRIDILNPDNKQQVLETYYFNKYSSMQLAQNHFYQPQRFACLSSTHIYPFELLQQQQKLKVICGSDLIYAPWVHRQLQQNVITDAGHDWELNYEKVVAAKPDVVITYGIDGNYLKSAAKFRELKLNPVLCMEFLEETPLARAEWIKFYGVLFNQYQLANACFHTMDSAYQFLEKKQTVYADTPAVMFNLPWENVWYMPAGNAYFSSLVRDAGGSYAWQDTRSKGSLRISDEEMMSKANAAEVWLHPNEAGSLAEMRMLYPQCVYYKSYTHATVFNNTKRSMQSQNDFWESGTYKPQKVLSDFIQILHGAAGDSASLYYYKKLY